MISLNRAIINIILACIILQPSLGLLHPDDQAILMNFYNSLTSKGTLSWNTTIDLCGQYGVYCDSSNPQRVIKLDLHDRSLIGTISTQLGNLTSLQYLWLYQNQLTGTIPSQLENLTNLIELAISENQLNGIIPTELGNLENLQRLVLYQNQLTGTIPTQLENLTKLYSMQIYSNQLSGPIPTFILTLPSDYLFIQSNYWDCPIPYYYQKNNDYSNAKSECDLSCPLNRCSNGGQCSTRLNGNFNCDCFPGTYGNICEIDINECEINNGGCDVDANCTNTIGSYECECKPGFIGNGTLCSPCVENEYPFNDTTCLPCPQNSTWMLKWKSITDCKCNSLNHYPDINTSTCLPCEFGFLLDDDSNTCQKIKCPTLSVNGSIFSPIEIDETSKNSTCLLNYYIFQSVSPYLPIQDAKGEAICKLNNDNITASWNIIQPCEPSCAIREGGCDNNQLCAKPIGETIERCICAGYIGKYCENIDPQGCDTLNCTKNGICIDKTETKGAYCDCTGIGYNGNFCENDINECLTNNGGCDSNAICTNTPGSFSCKCKEGYSGDGFICTDIDECLLGTNNCHSQANCINTIGSFNCICKSGYQGSGVDCYDIDECLEDYGGCDEQATCQNIRGSYTCTCKGGYSGDGFTCDPTSTFSNDKNENSQAVGIGVGVTLGLLTLVILVLLILFFSRRNKQRGRKSEKLKNDSQRESNLENISLTQNTTILAGDKTLLNTKFELSMPGFMNIDFVNQIRKEERIGGGGTAIIYKGIILDPKLKEKFEFEEIAIKQILEDQRFSLEDNQLKFEQEIAIIWGISSHPNVLTLVGYSENPRCIITKLYDQDLYQYIKNTSNIGSDLILRWAKDISSGMNMIHSAGIVHRDLKTSNILLEVQNNKMNAIICDFGLARISSEANAINQKIVNVKGFSPRYTAPEVFGRMMSNSTIIPIEDEMKSDVYSYSLILWEMMTRKIPWANLKETSEIDFQIRSGKREPIPDSNGDKILELLSTIIELSWKQIPSERPTFKQIDQKLSPISL